MFHFFFFGSVIPLLRESVGILMQRIPTGLEKSVHIAYQRVSDCSGFGTCIPAGIFCFIPSQN